MGIDIAYVSYAFSVGIVGFLNPCGFAMLPAYVAHYLGAAERYNRSIGQNILRALGLGLTVSAGFVTVFGLIGLLFSLIRDFLVPNAFWIGAIMGALLMVLGLLMLLGKNPLMIPAFERWAGRVSQIKGSQAEKDLLFYYLYGVSYALASLGCAMPIFLSVIGYSFTEGWLNGAVQFGAYALGMSMTMMAVSLISALSKNLMRAILPIIMGGFRWVSGLVVIGIGLYLIWYNLIYTRVLQL